MNPCMELVGLSASNRVKNHCFERPEPYLIVFISPENDSVGQRLEVVQIFYLWVLFLHSPLHLRAYCTSSFCSSILL